MDVRSDDISQAVVLWLGFGRAATPQRDDDAVLNAFGSELGRAVLETVRALESDFYASDARDTAPDLISKGDQAESEFRLRHPDLSEPAVKALGWAYTFDHK